ncbi:hypothetical protein FB451DRAFT_1129358 [Mycena latifolia]|nr:hypothetical protein FB451DRAFT_1129358 [Mycena latifolia]
MNSQSPTFSALGLAQPDIGGSSPPDSSIHVAPGTRHHGLLISNEAPLDLDFIAVEEMISKTDARLVVLDIEISRLQDRLKQLEDKRAALQTFRKQNVAVLSPLRRLPPEVLGEIFSWTLPSIHDTLPGYGFDIRRSPWVLGQISSRWRAVAGRP